jgi:thioredoxin reductase
MPHDVLIVGGGYAGLAAALVLARARRKVAVVDAGAPRNRFSSHAHNMLGQDGRPGAEILADARAQLVRYPTVQLLNAQVDAIAVTREGFVASAGAGPLEAKRIILATGVADVLPNIEGVQERWGQTVLHCPYCHGYEIGGGRIGVLGLSEHAPQYAALIADWGEVVFITEAELTTENAELLARRGVEVVKGRVESIEGAAPAIEALRLADGSSIAVKALFVGSATKQASPLAAQLGCDFEETPAGPIVRTDGQKRTSVTGVYAAGDAARAPHSITFAMFDGMSAGLAVHRDLVGI